MIPILKFKKSGAFVTPIALLLLPSLDNFLKLLVFSEPSHMMKRSGEDVKKESMSLFRETTHHSVFITLSIRLLFGSQ